VADTGWKNPATAANIDDSGGNAWSNVNNVFASDDSRATCDYSASNQHTDYLRATNFSFSIPAGATIDGIECRSERSFGGVAPYYDRNVRIVKGGAIKTTNNASGVQWPVSDTYITYGGSSDKWGETWLVSDINASNFGFAHSGTANTGWHSHHFKLDSMQIKVYYTEAAADDAAAMMQVI
jgi:hypothetical protein